MATDGWSYEDALGAIWARSGYDRGFVSNPFAGDEAAALGLRRVAALLDRFGRRHEGYGIVHVAGSKGKGSTCAFVAAILQAAGYRVGFYSSPHLHAFRERIAVDGEAIGEADFAALTERAIHATEALETANPALGEVTAFELATAMALDHFGAVGCDLAVVEVGLGGRLDATNVVNPLVAVITRLDLEHTAVLGDTIAAIARNKAGIIKPRRPVVSSPQPPAALAVIEEVAAWADGRLLVGNRDWHWSGSWRAFDAVGPWGTYRDLQLGLPGDHQVENACTALAAISLLDGAQYHVSEIAVREGLAQTGWPGRFERLTREGEAEIVLDGAHSPASAAALAAAVAAEYPGRRAILVVSVLADKDAPTIVRALAPVAERVIAAQSHSPRAVPAATVAAGAEAIGLPVEVGGDVRLALERAMALAGREGLVLVAGSLSVVAEAREALGLARPDPPPERPRAQG